MDESSTFRPRFPRMLFRLLLIACFLLTIEVGFARAATPSAPAAHFDFAGDRQPTVSLDGLWRFHPGDDPDGKKGWADPGLDDSAWPTLRSDLPWSEQGYRGMSGYGWYRFALAVPVDHPPLSIELGPVITAYQIFVDGKLAGQVGAMPPTRLPVAAWGYENFAVPAGSSRYTQPVNGTQIIHVAVRVWHSPIWAFYLGGGPQIGGHLLGDSQLLATEFRQRNGQHRLLFVDLFSYGIAAAIMSVTVFGLFLFRPREREYLWFALLLLAKALDQALNLTKEIYAFPPIPVFDLFDGALVACAQTALMLFIRRVLEVRRDPFQRIALGMAAISPILGVLYWPGWMSVPVSALFQVFFLLPSSVWVLVILAIDAIRRNTTARMLLVPVLLVQGLYLADNVNVALYQFGFIADPRILETPFITAPFTIHPSILAELLFLLSMLAFLIRRFTLARRREERWESAMEAAGQVQHLLLPEAIPQIEGFVVDCIYDPAESVGGDFFQILPMPDGGLLIFVGDVAGKGLPAAMLVSMIIGALRAEASHSVDPAHLLAFLNDRLVGRSGSGFTTCLCAHLSVGGRLNIASAGHPPPYRNGQELPMPGAIPLGMLAGLTYDFVTVQLAPGDRLTFLSDGVVEAQNKSGDLLGFERTEQLSIRSAAEIAEAARLFGQIDDITVVTIEFQPNLAPLKEDLTRQASV